jgi:hypothetical protein
MKDSYYYCFIKLYNQIFLKNKYLHYLEHPTIKKMMSLNYISMHNTIVVGACTILLLSNNLFYILILLNITLLDIFCIIVLKECPVFKLEKKYNSKTQIQWKAILYKYFHLEYHCRHYYEMQLDFLINLHISIYIKVFALLFFEKK